MQAEARSMNNIQTPLIFYKIWANIGNKETNMSQRGKPQYFLQFIKS